MVYINKLLLAKGVSQGVVIKHVERHVHGIEIKAGKNYTRINPKTGEEERIFQQLPISAGHGVEVKPSSLNKEGIGVEVKSKTGHIDENKYLAI